MAGREIAALGAAFTADGTANGFITVASTTGFYVKAFANLSDTTGRSARVQITQILSATQLGVRVFPQVVPLSQGSPTTPPAGGPGPGSAPPPPAGITYQSGPNYGRSDVSAFTLANGSRIDQEAQFIYNVNDQPLP